MSTETEGIKVRVPSNLSLRDVIMFITVAVSVTAAWGMISTRLTIVEKELIHASKSIEEVKQHMKDVDKTITQNEVRLRENEQMTENLWRTVQELQNGKK